jgi:hypothetical protein
LKKVALLFLGGNCIFRYYRLRFLAANDTTVRVTSQLASEITVLRPIPSDLLFVICFSRSSTSTSCEEFAIMEWTTPQHEEIDLNCEVSSYANAEL